MPNVKKLYTGNGASGKDASAGYTDKSWFGWRFDDVEKTCYDSARHLVEFSDRGAR